MIQIDDKTLMQANIENVVKDLFRDTINSTEAAKRVYKVAVDFDMLKPNREISA